MIRNRYAQALFDICVKNDTLESMVLQFDSFMTIVNDNLEWLKIIGSPLVNRLKKKEMIDSLPNLDKQFRRFLYVISRNNHALLLNGIYEEWVSITNRHNNIAYVSLYTAKKPTKKQQEQMAEEIQPYFPGLEIKFHVIIDKRLIHGQRMIYQGKSIDRSIKSELQRLEQLI